MAHSFHVEVVSPERMLFSGEATMVVTRTLDGEIAFMAGHAPVLAALRENHTRLHLVDGTVVDVAVHGGFVQVSGTGVSILSDVAELATDIDVTRARLAQERLEARATNEHDAEIEAALRRAQARISAAGGPTVTH
jgi:F-type H+-transporting ATPase subunit epsilon